MCTWSAPHVQRSYISGAINLGSQVDDGHQPRTVSVPAVRCCTSYSSSLSLSLSLLSSFLIFSGIRRRDSWHDTHGLAATFAHELRTVCAPAIYTYIYYRDIPWPPRAAAEEYAIALFAASKEEGYNGVCSWLCDMEWMWTRKRFIYLLRFNLWYYRYD